MSRRSLVGGQQLRRVHPSEACRGHACAVHAPSDHHMASWDQNWRGDRGMMERLCPEHGIGHPDPDHMAFVRRTHGEGVARGQGIHGCCGCCRTALTVPGAVIGGLIEPGKPE